MPFPGIGGAALITGRGPKIIRLAKHGHSNRPFYHIVLTNMYLNSNAPPVEQLGSYDPMVNKDNQKLLSLNIERTRYWMGQGAYFSPSLANLLGMVGFLPIHPKTYIQAWRTRNKEAMEAAEAKATAGQESAKATATSQS